MCDLPSEDSQIGQDPHRAETHVDIGKTDPDKAQPSKQHMTPIEAADTAIGGSLCWFFSQDIQSSSNQMSQRVTT
jgi:hypothetical protein